MSRASLYTPWRDDWDEVRARTRGRGEAIEAIEAGARQLVAAGRTLPLYFFGPRGVGKSHVVTDGVGRARSLGLSVTTLGEDLPELGDPDTLWARMTGGAGPAWTAWDRPASSLAPRRGLVVVEGFDRQLAALGADGRKRLRSLLDANPDVWIVATGARLPQALTGKEEAFFGAFRTLPLHPLDDDDAGALLDHEAGEAVELDPRWPARRAAIVLLAGGNPRALVALGGAVRAAPAQEVAQRLLVVLDAFTPHYQLRFRDLNPQEQQLVDLLTQAPRELGPTDIAGILGSSPQSWSTCAHRLSDLGVLRIRQGEGRRAWYGIAEPLFRYWLEFRSAPSWSDTRVAWLGELLEHVLGPDELVDTWSDPGDEVLGQAALRALKRKPQARQKAWAKGLPEVEAAIVANDPAALGAAVQRMSEVVPDAASAWSLARQLGLRRKIAAGRALGRALTEHGATTLGTLLSSVGDAGQLRRLLVDLAAPSTWAGVGAPGAVDLRAVTAYFDDAARRIDRRGRSWVLDPDERRVLRDFPFLRGRLARFGRRSTDPPALLESDLLEADITRTSEDLGDLLWATVSGHLAVASARVLGVMREAPDARLPWCPWPGRRLTLDGEALLDVAVRHPSPAALSWLAAMLEVSDSRFAGLIEHPALGRLRPQSPLGSGVQLALTSTARGRADRYQGLRAALSHPDWSPVFDRVDLLVRQLDEGARGPLHPELARIDEVVRPKPE